MMICEQSFGIAIVIVLGHHKLLPYKMIDFISKCVCLTVPLAGHCPVSFPLLGPPYSLFITILKIGQLVT